MEIHGSVCGLVGGVDRKCAVCLIPREGVPVAEPHAGGAVLSVTVYTSFTIGCRL